MAAPKPILLMNDGGMDALVACGTLREEPRVVPVFVRTGFAGERWWWESFEAQTEAFGFGATEVLEMQHLIAGSGVDGERAPTPLATVSLLTAVAGLALERRAKAVVWPIRVGADERRIATITEQLILLGDLIELEHGQRLPIETPLLELTDRELVEVGMQMGVGWALSRSCLTDESDPWRWGSKKNSVWGCVKIFGGWIPA
ncbi:MAG: hypothetical protein ACYTGQ_07375 [Planctomycetota bacterium]|jgi:hypothetical protein